VKILHVISGLGIGGAENMLAKIAIALQQRGWSQHIVSLARDDELLPLLTSHDIPVNIIRASGTGSAIGAVVRLTALVRQLQPQIIQGWMYHGNVAAALAHRLAPYRSARRLFWGLRASNMDVQRYGWITRLNKLLSNWPDVIVANSEAGARVHAELGFRPRRLEVISNGVDIERFHPDAAAREAVRSDLGIASDAVIAVHVARVDPMKDHATFIEAMRQVPGVTGLMVGKRTEHLPVPPNMRAVGLRSDVERICAAGDMIVSSSGFGEGFSNAIAEGMACGLVPIATDVGDAKIIVGKTGRIVELNNPPALAAAISAEACMSAEERRQRGLGARQRIVETYTIERMINAYKRIYDSVGCST
jgi:glycosyltransferase involved in cell wall biosynthesis